MRTRRTRLYLKKSTFEWSVCFMDGKVERSYGSKQTKEAAIELAKSVVQKHRKEFFFEEEYNVST